MPRAAKYDRRIALDKAVALFWARGYHATSLKQLEQALDMRPGSLYAAFGSKQSLFMEALDVYAVQMVNQLEAHLESAPSPLLALQSFLRELVLGGAAQDEAPARACMIVKTLMEVTEDEEPLSIKVNELLADMEEIFEDLLTRSRREGELRADVDCVRLARLVQVQVMGLRSYAQRQVTARELEPLLADINALLDAYRVRH